MARQLLCAWIWFLILAYPPGVKGAAAGDNEVVAFAGAGSIGAAVLANGDLYLPVSARQPGHTRRTCLQRRERPLPEERLWV